MYEDDDEDLDECDICGEPLRPGQELGEFVEDDHHVIAHVQCGLDAKLETA